MRRGGVCGGNALLARFGSCPLRARSDNLAHAIFTSTGRPLAAAARRACSRCGSLALALASAAWPCVFDGLLSSLLWRLPSPSPVASRLNGSWPKAAKSFSNWLETDPDPRACPHTKRKQAARPTARRSAALRRTTAVRAVQTEEFIEVRRRAMMMEGVVCRCCAMRTAAGCCVHIGGGPLGSAAGQCSFVIISARTCRGR